MRYTPALRPWKHQAHAIKRLWNMGSALLWADTGVGKTKTVADYAFALHTAGRVQRVLIVCPLAAVGVWEDELSRNIPPSIPARPTIYSQNEMQRLSDLPHTLNDAITQDFSFVIVTYNALSRYNKALIAYKPDLLVFDESHYVKSYKATRTRRALSLARHATYVACLSGTPAPNGYIDLYWQIKMVHPLVLPPTLQEFKDRYCALDYYGTITGYQNVSELAKRLSAVTIRIKKDVLDLPPTVNQTVPVVLDSVADRAYRKLKEQLVLSLENTDEPVVAPNQLVLLLRLAQLTGGWLQGEAVGAQAKLQALMELLSSLNEKVIIWCRFLDEIKGICYALQKQGITCQALTGGVTGRQRTEVIRSFQQQKAPQVLVCQLAALGVGVTLTAASKVVFYSLDFNSETYEQAYGRTHRPGQRETCHYYHLIARGTVDEYVLAAVQRKTNQQALLGEVVRRLAS